MELMGRKCVYFSEYSYFREIESGLHAPPFAAFGRSFTFDDMASKHKIIPLLFLIGVLCSLHSKGQGSISDSSLFLTTIAPSYAYQIPDGDLRERFGPNSNIAMRVGIKTGSNIQLDLVGAFIFGNNVRIRDEMLQSLKTSKGYVLTAAGERAQISYSQRGFSISLQAGKVFPLGYNPNSGILLKAGAGFLQHNVRIKVEDRRVPHLNEDRTDYFDRRASGLTFHEFVGYQHFANNRVANFFIGLEFFQAFPENRRSFNVDDIEDNGRKRFDMLHGIRAGFMLPLYDSESKEVYYY